MNIVYVMPSVRIEYVSLESIFFKKRNLFFSSRNTYFWSFWQNTKIRLCCGANFSYNSCALSWNRTFPPIYLNILAFSDNTLFEFRSRNTICLSRIRNILYDWWWGWFIVKV